MTEIDKKTHLRQIERQLIPRLKLMGVILLFFGLFSLIYAFFVHPLTSDGIITEEEFSQESQDVASRVINSLERIDETPVPEETLNFFGVAIVFSSIGLSCIFIAWKKRHQHELDESRLKQRN